jgi:hypothetical protein
MNVAKLAESSSHQPTAISSSASLTATIVVIVASNSANID